MGLRTLCIYLMLIVRALEQGYGLLSERLVSAENIDVYESDTVVMSCPISESDEYVDWLIDNEFHSKHSEEEFGYRRITLNGALTMSFESVGRYSVINDRTYGNLTITKVNLSEAGNIFCYDQWHNEQKRTFQLHVLVNISTLQSVENKSASAGDNVTLPYQVNSMHNLNLMFLASRRAPQFTVWNGNAMCEKFVGRVSIAIDETSEAADVTIINVQRNDTGYYVGIENRDGYMEAHGVFLTVHDFQHHTSEESAYTIAIVVLVTLVVIQSLVIYKWVIRHRIGNCCSAVKGDAVHQTEVMPLSSEQVPNVTSTDVLKRNRQVLLRSIDPTDRFVDQLSDELNLGDREMEKIKQRPSADDKNSRLFGILSRQSVDVINKFIFILKENNQDHVAALLCGETAIEKLPMTDEHCEILLATSNTMRLFLDLEGGLLENLLSRKTLLWRDKLRVESKSTIAEKASELLSILMRKADAAFEDFILALRETGQLHIVHLLAKTSDPPASELPMSSEHCRILREMSSKLRCFLNPHEDLLDTLYSNGTFEEHDMARVRSEKKLDIRATQINAILRRKPDGAFDKFISALRENNQPHVVHILTGEGEPPMSDGHLASLRCKRDTMIHNISITCSSLVVKLAEKNVLTSYDEKVISEGVTENDKVQRLIDILSRKPDSAYSKFVQSLNESGHEHAAQELKNKPISAKAHPHYENNAPLEIRKEAEAAVIDQINSDNNFKATLQQNRVYVCATDGCIAVHFSCATVDAVNFLETYFKTGQLQELFNNTFYSSLFEHRIYSCILLIDSSEFERYRNNLRKSTLLSQQQRQALEYAADKHLDDLIVTDELLQLLTVSKMCIQYVRQKRDRRSEAKFLLDVLCRHPNGFYKKFLQALKQTNQRQLADVMTNVTINKTVEITFYSVLKSSQPRTRKPPIQDYDVYEPVTNKIVEHQIFREGIIRKQESAEQHQVIDEVVSTAPYEIMEPILLKASSILHNTVHVRPRGDVATLTILSSVCLDWWNVLMRDTSKQRERRASCRSMVYNRLRIYKRLRFPLILQKAAFIKRRTEKKEPLESRDADVAALKELCVCRHWWLVMTDILDINRQQIKRLFNRVPRLIGHLNGEIEYVEYSADDDDVEVVEVSKSRDNRFVESSSNCKSFACSSSVERRHEPATADSAVQRFPVKQSTDRRRRRREVCGVTKVNNKIFILFNIREDYGSSLYSFIYIFSDRRPFERLEQIKISKLKDPKDIVACCETFQLFIGGSHDIWRVDIKTSGCQQFEYSSGVESMSLSSRRLLVTSFTSDSLIVFDVLNGEKLLFIKLPKPTFNDTFHAIESNKQTFFVIHRNASSYEVSEINSGGQLIRSSGRQLGLRWPRHLAFDSIGRLLVADSDNRRILLLNEELKLERVLLEYEELSPWRLNYNKKTNQLIVGFSRDSFCECLQLEGHVRRALKRDG